MSSINSVILVGRVGRDPEGRYTKQGESVATFSLATDGYNDKTDWHNVTVFGKTAGNVVKHVKKGSVVGVSGRIQYEEYEKDGQKKYITKIIANAVQFLGGKNGNDVDPNSDIPF